MSMMRRNHPRRYHLRPDDYPHGLNYLDAIGKTDPGSLDDTSLYHRWLDVLYLWEVEIRALKRQLKADRDAALAKGSDDQPEWRPQTIAPQPTPQPLETPSHSVPRSS